MPHCYGLFEVVAELLAAARVAELRQRLRLDLADPLAGETELLADLVEGARLSVGQAEPQRDDRGLALRQRLEDAVELTLEQAEGDDLGGDRRVGVLDEVTELTVALVADVLLEAHRLAGVTLDLDDLVRGHVELGGQLVRGGLAAEVLEHLALH